MARPREFEPNEALKRAMQLFWAKGYEETSMADLVEATGVSRYGFYTEFGDKNDLFLRCVDYYSSTTIEMALAPLERADAGLPQIHGYFDQFLNALQSEQPNMGCLIGNTAMSSSAWDVALNGRIRSHFSRMRAAFHNAL
ncbi:MAG TPA: helix-turn-helix domain-containing protein, partial [Anaerolineae bacterium]|nr:helix-turn-helix domain-containing protein [Anaerolineae bacterium]